MSQIPDTVDNSLVIPFDVPKVMSKFSQILIVMAGSILMVTFVLTRPEGPADNVGHPKGPAGQPKLAQTSSARVVPQVYEAEDDDVNSLDLPVPDAVEIPDTAAQVEDIPGRMVFDNNGQLVVPDNSPPLEESSEYQPQ